MPVRRKHVYSPEVNLGELLMRFFEVYAQEVNYDCVGISVVDMRYTPKEVRRDSDKKQALLSIEDPLLITNEVGRSSFNYALVRSAFEQALQILKGVFIRDRRCGVDWQRFYKGSMMSLIMPFTQEQLQYRNWLKSFVLEYKEPELPPSTVVCNTLLAPSIDLAKCALQQYIMSLPRSSRPLEIVDPRDLERMSTTTTATSPSHENGSEMTCTSSSASDAAGPVVNGPIDETDRSATASVKSDSSEAVIEKVGNLTNGNAKNSENVTAKEGHRNGEKPATLAAIVAGTTGRSKPKQLIDDIDKKNGNSPATKDRTPSPSENKTPPLTSAKTAQPVSHHAPPSSHGRVFHNQQYYKTERAASLSRDGASGRGTRPLVTGGNSMRRKPVVTHSPTGGTASPAPHPQSNFVNGTLRSSRSGPASRKAYPTTYYKRNGERVQAARRDTTPRLASDDGGESSERDSVKNDGYQTVRSRNRPRHK